MAAPCGKPTPTAHALSHKEDLWPCVVAQTGYCGVCGDRFLRPIQMLLTTCTAVRKLYYI